MIHTSLSIIRALAAIAIFIPSLLFAEMKNGEPSLPWWSGGMRIHHPNISAWDVREMDFDEFVAEAVSIHANAVVLTAGGLVAFYPSEITGHYVSEKLEGRDFIGEVTPRPQRPPAHSPLRKLNRIETAQRSHTRANGHHTGVARGGRTLSQRPHTCAVRKLAFRAKGECRRVRFRDFRRLRSRHSRRGSK